jgi:hypothetical protein
VPLKTEEEVQPSDSPGMLYADPSRMSTDNIATTSLVWSEQTRASLLEQQAEKNTLQPYPIVQVGDQYGFIQDNRLVVNANRTTLFWRGGQTLLCNLLREMTFVKSFEEPNKTATLPIGPRPLLNMTFACTDILNHVKDLGQGNWITAHYLVGMAAAKAQVDYQFQCDNKREGELKLLLPWFAGYHAAPSPDIDTWPYGGSMPTEQEACEHYYPRIRVDKMANRVVDDIQKMAVTLVGSRDAIRRHPDVPVDQAPVIPNVTLDDVAIHFRCGDVMGGENRNDFGMIRYNEYEKWISKDARSIGILTQPFDKARNRNSDVGRVENCRQATFLLVRFLQLHYPNATISIHNGPTETLPLAYARLAMANQTFTSLSSFGIFPVMGTFGQGYFQQGNRGVNPFSIHLPNLYPNMHMMKAKQIGSGTMRKMKLEEILAWFVAEDELAVGMKLLDDGAD